MVVIPAIDILGGKCVRLTQGDYDRSNVYSDNPADVAMTFAAAGARRLHVVDLDAARGGGDNSAVIDQILRHAGIEVQVAGGLRSLEAIETLTSLGARWVVMGTAAVTDPTLFEGCARRYPGRVMGALDIRKDQAAVDGWMHTSGVTADALLAKWDQLPLAGVIVTSIDRDGTMSGPDLETLSRVRQMTALDLQYSGGVSSIDDIGRVAAAGAQGVILGKAIYEGRIKLEEAMAI